MRSKWGKAKLEVLALSDQIILLHSQGFNVGEIFIQLKSENELSIKKRIFYRHVSLILSQKNQNPLILTRDSGQKQSKKAHLETSAIIPQNTPSHTLKHNNLTTDEEARQSWHQEQ